MSHLPPAHIAELLQSGLDGDADQRAATNLLISAGRGIWLAKLAGWTEYLCPIGDLRAPLGLFFDWHQLREDLASDDLAWAAFDEWARSYAGRAASEDQYESRLAAMVPRRPWHGASSSELVLLRIALELAPGGLFGDGLPRLDARNRRAVLGAMAELAGS